ncbi:MAG: AAA family ATPase, partial [Deltaproteobacteria bacterium]|nr:AAA family ATPase [Deltaproteobacteria bacterium]
ASCSSFPCAAPFTTEPPRFPNPPPVQELGSTSVPFATVDATEYTEAGCYGKDVEVMVSDLLYRADHSVEAAQRGIVLVDEVDKIARRTQGARTDAGARDIGGEGVQQALLRLLERREIYVPLNVPHSVHKHDFVQLNTRDVLFICAGAFSDRYQKDEHGCSRPVGFHAAPRVRGARRLTLRELVESGMPPEFLGRLPVMVELQRLEVSDLVRILTEPPGALARECRELLALDGVELRYTQGAVEQVARFAVDRGLGARGLRSVLEAVMADVLLGAPGRGSGTLTVDSTFVRRRLQASPPGLFP